MSRERRDRNPVVASLIIVLAAVGASAALGASAPARFYGYAMSAQARMILVLDTSTNANVKRVAHPDLFRPANCKFHPNPKRF